MTVHRTLARSIAALHILFTLFVIFGSVLVMRWPSLLWVHLAAVGWAVLNLITNLGCVLTTWEKDLLRWGGEEPYPEGFLQHHVFRREFTPEVERWNHALLGIGALVLNAAVYAFVFWR